MNLLYQISIALVSVSFFAACGAETADTTSAQTDTTTIQPDTAVAALQVSPYEADWNNFKLAIQDKDEPAIGSFIQDDVIDTESLLLTFSDTTYSNSLVKTGYTDLLNTTYNEKAVREFSVQQEYTDEEGNTYESAIFLYFEETPQGLKLVGVLMAG